MNRPPAPDTSQVFEKSVERSTFGDGLAFQCDRCSDTFPRAELRRYKVKERLAPDADALVVWRSEVESWLAWDNNGYAAEERAKELLRDGLAATAASSDWIRQLLCSACCDNSAPSAFFALELLEYRYPATHGIEGLHKHGFPPAADLSEIRSGYPLVSPWTNHLGTDVPPSWWGFAPVHGSPGARWLEATGDDGATYVLTDLEGDVPTSPRLGWVLQRQDDDGCVFWTLIVEANGSITIELEG